MRAIEGIAEFVLGRQAQAADARIRIAIKDQGIGMDQKEVRQIFLKFYRTKKAEESGEAGTGIGLSIVQQIVEQHSGEHEQDDKNDAGPGEKVDRGSARPRTFNGLDGLHVVVRDFSFADLVTLCVLYDETFVGDIILKSSSCLVSTPRNSFPQILFVFSASCHGTSLRLQSIVP